MSNFPTTILLKVSNFNRNWSVKLIYEDCCAILSDGLKEFLNFFNVRKGSVLWFERIGGNVFNVKIGNPTGIEKNYMKYIDTARECNPTSSQPGMIVLF